MIHTVTLNNFQSHDKTEIELSDGMNVIHGPSDNGKSSIIRGIRWCVLNKPNGEEFRRHHTKNTFVRLEAENAIVERRRSNKKNEYEMDDKVFKALRKGVPEEITEMLNIAESNLQAQHEVYFLIDQSPGQISKKLNEVAGLEKMDEASKQINSKVRKNNQEFENAYSQYKAKKEQVAELRWLKKADKFLTKLEKLQIIVNNLEYQYETFSKILDDLASLKKYQKNFISDKAIIELDKIQILQNKYDLEVLKYDRTTRILKKLRSETKNLDTAEIIELKSLEKLQKSLDREQSRYNRISEHLKRLKLLKTQFSKVDDVLTEMEIECQEELSRLGTCPTCGANTSGN